MIVYDLIFLFIFIIFFSTFLYFKKKEIKREGLFILYRAKWGINLMDYVGKKYKKTLKFFSYVSIITGYFLMIGVLWLFGRTFWEYITRSTIMQAMGNIPPIMPIFPYFDRVLSPTLSSIYPSFYAVYFVVIIAVIAISHEFAHGILMRRYGVKIKSTGFAFFPSFLPLLPAAFVEQEEKSFSQTTNFNQMAILSAGAFVNFLTAILFLFVALFIFNYGFIASGVAFDDYAFTNVNVSQINSVNGVEFQNPSIEQISELLKEGEENKIVVKEYTFSGVRGFSADGKIIQLYFDSPAFKNNLEGVITEIDGKETKNRDSLQEIFSGKYPGDSINIKTKQKEEVFNYDIELEKNPFSENPEDIWLGINFLNSPAIIGDHRTILPFGEMNVFYEPKYPLVLFIYNLFFYLIIASFSVALVNMLPVGVLDGGRFFYLTVLGITGNKKFAERGFSIVTKLILFALLVMMIAWAINIFL